MPEEMGCSRWTQGRCPGYRGSTLDLRSFAVQSHDRAERTEPYLPAANPHQLPLLWSVSYSHDEAQPAGEPAAGGTVDMVLIDDDTVQLKPPGDSKLEQWKRCAAATS